jgi:hypothetical protein
MEPLKYNTKIDGRDLHIPEHILEQLDKEAEIEVVFRQRRRSYRAGFEVDQVIKKIEKQMNEEFPNLRGPIGKELANLAGISRDIEGNMRKYTDKEILGMARMKKYLEKEEIIESLF